METLPKSLLRQDAFLFDLQQMIKETRENIDKLADLVLKTDNYEEIVSRIPHIYMSKCSRTEICNIF